jgi:hypothetical protein
MSEETDSGEYEQATQTRQRKEIKRSIVIPIDDLNLDTPEGQAELLRRCQTALAQAPNLTVKDLQIINALKSTIKVKSDVEIWKAITKLQEEIEKLKSR